MLQGVRRGVIEHKTGGAAFLQGGRGGIDHRVGEAAGAAHHRYAAVT